MPEDRQIQIDPISGGVSIFCTASGKGVWLWVSPEKVKKYGEIEAALRVYHQEKVFFEKLIPSLALVVSETLRQADCQAAVKEAEAYLAAVKDQN